MKKFKPALTALALVGICAVAQADNMSPPADVITSASSVYWNALVSKSPHLTCKWPSKATRAELRITGKGVNHVQAFVRGAADDFLEIDSPVLNLPKKFADERLLSFMLSFDDGTSFARTLAAITGVDDAATRVVVTDDLDSRNWQKVSRRAIIPIAENNVDEVMLNDVAVPSGLNGNPGWYEWNDIPLGLNTFSYNDKTATLLSIADGGWILLR